ncbi:DASS family sodium-coupled anion symporter [Brevibacterium litoralis]|uniref:DASS family sodium-coupled anion symporter n=1 Tax=Brevibacterium litoralis TaxID=3138935 RepID=UPI0032F02134
MSTDKGSTAGAVRTASSAAAGAAAPAGTSSAGASSAGRKNHSWIWQTALVLVVTVAIWLVPPQADMDPRGMHMLAIFVGTILALIFQILPTPSISLIGLSAAMITGSMSVGDGEALQGFANSTVLLIVAAFFIADGFLITGLGRRIALVFVSLLGRTPLGVSYGLAITDLVLAPATPSNTARAGGVVYPIIRSIAGTQGSTPETEESRKKVGAYLVFTAAFVNTITSAMFVTAMAGNPVAQSAAADLGIELTWGGWAWAALVPGLVSLVAVPWVMTKIYPPTTKSTPEAPLHARASLVEMGRMSAREWIMSGTFLMLLVLWMFGGTLGVNATAAAFLGIAVLLVTKVLTWKDMAGNASAWNTFIFFAVLVGMATHLADLGVIAWVGVVVSGWVSPLHWSVAFVVLALVYFYSHYLFASNTAHITAMYAVFLGAAVAAGAPPLFAAAFFGFLGNLFGALTHYASGPSGVVYGSGYVKVSEWFRVAFVMSIVVLVIWAVVGGAWLKLLGWW